MSTKITQALTSLKTEFILQKPLLIGDESLQSLLDISSVNQAQYGEVAQAFAANQGINPAFWQALEKLPGLDSAAIQDLKVTVDLGVITKNHLPTLKLLKANINDPNQPQFKGPRDYAKLSQQEWVKLIQDSGSGFPTNLSNENEFAAVLVSQSERLFPDVALVAGAGRSGQNSLSRVAEIATFLDDHPDFNLGRDDLIKYNRDNHLLLPEETLQEARVLQRIHRITPTVAAGNALLDQKLHSSVQIYFRGQGRLIESLVGQGVARAEAARIYRVAENQYAHTLATLMRFRAELQLDSPSAVADFTYSATEIEKFKEDIPNLEVLFGSLDYCECEHCSSLYSPAAYLTDLLRFLEEKDAIAANTSVKDVLFDRRPDIGNIKLNCENTKTPLPHIDLVNEILENVIAPANRDFSYQSTLTAAELRAVPEHIRPHAYETLKDAVYPMNVAFNLWQEETRLFLRHLGAPRYQLMETFQNRSNPAARTPADVDIAAEFFGISSQERAIILPSASQANKTKQNLYWRPDTNRADVPVAEFLEKARISYPQLLDLLQVRFVNPPGNQSVIQRPVDDCDVDQQLVDRMTLAKFDRMHRFLRLWRRSGWEMWELDLLIRNPKVGNGTLGAACLVALRRFRELQTALSLSTEELLAFYGRINTETRVTADTATKVILPLYHRLFLNIAVANPLDPSFNLPLAGGSLANHKTTILSALAITDEEFTLLLPKTNGQLTEASLATLYRYSILARKLRLSIKDLLLLLKVTGMNDPFVSLIQTQTLLRWHTAIKASGLSLLQLDYVLNYAPDSPIGLRTETIIQYISALRTGLSNLQDELLNSNDTQRERMEKHLSKLPEFSNTVTLNTALDLIEGKWNDSDPARQAFISTSFSVFIPDSANPNGILTQENFFDGDPLTPAEEQAISNRYDFVLGHLYPYLNANLITDHFASYLNLPSQQASLLLNELELPGGTPNQALREYLQTKALIARDANGAYLNTIDMAEFPEIFQVYALVHKQSILLNKLRLEPEELGWYIQHHAQVGTLDLESLPVSAPPGTSLFNGWLAWQQFLEFSRRFPTPEAVSFYDILDMGADDNTNLNTLLEKLAEFTQWSLANLQGLHQGLGLKHAPGDPTLDYAKAETYRRLYDCMQMMRRTGVDAPTMFTWANRSNPAQDAPIAQAVRQAAKSKYQVSEWLRIVEPVQDELREKKRAALVAYLIEDSLRSQPPTINQGGEIIPNPLYWQDANDLYGYFLIDVEMSSCQLTSRLRQAISAAQLFVQRCFLNLEARFVKVPKVDPDLENNWSQWKWMKTYRIWEANRKVFFYPENWIEPELRDDKSPFFRELEDEILQHEITHANVEQAFLNYLQKVDEVARLEIMGIYHDFDPSRNEVHVLGRTRTLPHQYYHRTYSLDYLNWSPWERIDVDITGDHAIPVVYNRKLHIFWLIFEEKPVKIKKNPGMQANASNNGSLTVASSDNPEPPRVMEIQLAWTVKKHTGWTPKMVSKEKMIHPWQRPHHSYHLRPRYKSSDNTLWLDLYISTTEEFNNTRFYDQFLNTKQYKTKNRFQETYRPWHSSSFVFDGGIVDLKLRGLWAVYVVPREKSSGLVYESAFISSHLFVQENFGPAGRAIKPLQGVERSGRLALPGGMHMEYNALTNNTVHSPNSNQLNIIPSGFSTAMLLKKARNPFRAVMPMQSLANRPFVYQDSERTFFVKSEWIEMLASYQTKVAVLRYVFFPLYHPYTALFIRELNRSGLDGLLTRKIQTQPETFPPTNGFRFTNSYAPVAPHMPDATAQQEIVDFTFGGAYSIYNWEIFFHAPMFIAGKLSQNQRFEEAMRWYHYIFDPTNTEDLPIPQRYWITKPFYERTSNQYKQERIQNLIARIDEYSDQVIAWKNNPFKPHLIARYRETAYQRNVVMKYIDNLIAWGDQLFRRETMEAIDEAALLYMLAYELLGERPKMVPAIPRSPKTYNELLAEGKLDMLGNQRVEVAAENEIGLPIRVTPSNEAAEPLPRLELLYFCIPHNEKLIGYWDTVEDRLFKIRHCMNIEGVVRQLPLFAPPIDPALLVKAAAAGVDLASVLSDLSVPNPNYRFRALHPVAVQFCSEVKSLGDKLLEVLEKRDAEGLALLRSSHEVRLMEAILEVRKKQVEEAQENVNALIASEDVIDKRIEYFGGIPYMNTWEAAGATLHGLGIVSEIVATILSTIAGTAHLIPKFEVGAEGFGGSPRVTLKYGGENVGKSSADFSALFRGLAGILHSGASMLETQGNYQRKAEENAYQKALAELEKIEHKSQLAAAEIRVLIAEKEQENQELQIEQARSEDEYLRNKYTNQQLYNWMLTQVASIYFQAYQLAYDMAKRTEKSFRYELGLQDTSFIKFGYWDSLKKGLLAGDKLMFDLYRMQTAYLDQHKRELELTKHISLAQIAPWSLLQLKMTGECFLELPEWLFDMDYPGHYMRRIKTVAVTIPCVTGPYTGIHCTLALHTSRIRISNLVGQGYAMVDADDPRFRQEYGAIQSIATSHAQNDSGLFELSFSDERFLPFEGAGAVGLWSLRLPQENNQFDFSTISDVILHIQYTARDGGANLAAAAQAAVKGILPVNGLQLFSLKRQFPTAWHRFLHPDADGADQELKMAVTRQHYPFFVRGAAAIAVANLEVVIAGRHDSAYRLEIQLPGQGAADSFDVGMDPALNQIHHISHALPAKPNGEGTWNLKIRHDDAADFKSLPVDDLEDIFLVVQFESA